MNPIFYLRHHYSSGGVPPTVAEIFMITVGVIFAFLCAMFLMTIFMEWIEGNKTLVRVVRDNLHWLRSLIGRIV